MISQSGRVKYKVLYSKAVYGQEEIQAVLHSYRNGFLAHGPLVSQFEKKVANGFGKKYGIAVNSGSSANLLLMKSLLGDRPPGYVLTPACTFSTTVSAITLAGHEPWFIDVVEGQYVIDVDKLECTYNHVRKRHSHTYAILVPQLIGGVADMPRLARFAKKHDLLLIDDSCDTLFPTIDGKTASSYADATTTSFYGSHIITASGMGGMILTDDGKLRDKLCMYRDWGRIGNDNDNFYERFNFSIDDIPYDGKFVYGVEGFNLKMNEASAAFGLVQLHKFDKFRKIRSSNFKAMYLFFKEFEKYFILPQLIKGAKTNWLAFPLTIRKDAPFKRVQFLSFLEKCGIQTRVLFSGNITRHIAYKHYSDTFPIADHIMERGFLLGCHHGMDLEQVLYIKKCVLKFMKKL